MREIKPDYSQTFLFPPALDDWVGEDHPARFIRDFVDSLDLASVGFKGRRSPDGRPSYSDDLLLKAWILGYFNDIRSSRKLERACKEMMGFLWITGRHTPDHNTLWRFFRRYLESIQQVFVETVKLAAQAKLLNLKIHAVDGTKMRARCSDDGAMRQKDLEQALAAEEDRIAEYMEDVARAEEEEEGQYRLPDELKDAEARKKWIKEQLEKLRSEGVRSQQSTEPDARQMRGRGGAHFGYNAQAVVDVESGLVVACDVTNDQSDSYQLVSMAHMAKENLGSEAEVLLADAGYATVPEIGQLFDEKTNVTVDLPRRLRAGPEDSEFHAARFIYDEDRDVVICPLGHELHYIRTEAERHKRFKQRVYTCRNTTKCHRRADCCRSEHTRTVDISPYQKALQEQRDKYKNPEERQASSNLRKRVEILFGDIRANRHFQRFTGWGQDFAAAQWSLLCATGNLRKLYRTWAKQLAVAQA